MTIKQMIRRGATGYRRADVLFLGRVRKITQVPGGGTKAIVTMSVRAHPVGFAPHVSRIQTRIPDPEPDPDRLNFVPDHRYAIVAHGVDDGVFDIQETCGPSKGVSRGQMRRLLRLARRH